MKQEDLQKLSEAILDMDSEVAYRSAISRSYYSAFHAIREITSDTVLDKAPPGSHAVVTAKLKAKYGKTIAKHFHKMKKERNSADYDLHKTFFRKDATRMFNDRRFLLDEVAVAHTNQADGKGER
ncbi:HEPN domain-containing protein [Vreelandella titanicae]|uniref:HEPN domain-containing protein n=1 Tax=Vreelandella titanicae TaxID=664683 RepID=UPI003CFDFC98|tara:strand:+ start:6629 stop:7003 length:375 start_codon:yes stop_codon:yes gene_type:complete